MSREMGREAMALKVEVSNESDVEQMVKTVLDKYGKIDVLVNNAGVAGWVRAEEMSLEEWNRVIGINLTAVI